MCAGVLFIERYSFTFIHEITGQIKVTHELTGFESSLIDYTLTTTPRGAFAVGIFDYALIKNMPPDSRHVPCACTIGEIVRHCCFTTETAKKHVADAPPRLTDFAAEYQPNYHLTSRCTPVLASA
jgi:hypothetical protein